MLGLFISRVTISYHLSIGFFKNFYPEQIMGSSVWCIHLPLIVINATDMTHGTRLGFTQDIFDYICSDLSRFPIARAVAASSAVPMVLSPIILRNYAGTCGFKIPENFEEALKNRHISERQFYLANNIAIYSDSKRKSHIHLVDGGVSDNLGLRAPS